ncbi:transport protein Avl9-domain-containing protein [Rhodofomes roseus]|uniref:Transport protein Avl9-domain-containing protein n=1 Tax=Rhodofomes roseus TaxID=34475 RepID=A0ABQ8KSC7_9APHY|nr:transport protein Avl9-domain-containing protein [Rhodofomes roseus]KAH9841715.1 transport protein Avl9-domain-containing protein [Rhodofomes roseus]
MASAPSGTPSPFDDSPSSLALNTHFLLQPEPEHDESGASSDIAFSDGDTASQRSIALSSPTHSPRPAAHLGLQEEEEDQVTPSAITPVSYIRQSLSYSKRNTLDTDFSSDVDDDRSFFMRRMDDGESPISSVAPSVLEEREKPSSPPPMPRAPASPPPPTRPPVGVRGRSDTDSVISAGSEGTTYSKKARPESLLPQANQGPLVLGIALVDFDHLVGPKIEFSRGAVCEDEEIAKILPFLALPDGAHLSSEDYSYFHLVPTGPNPSTIFGISCNRQIRAAELLVKEADVTRSTVQKAVVVLASKPVFGLIRDRLGVITRALFAQRDFSDMSILDDFHTSLEHSLRSQMTESGLYMGTSLRELVHTFRQRTLVLLKALMLQKKIMFFGHPVERLCTYQYSLVTLVPGLLQNLDDCGSPPLAARAQSLTRPTSLRTSDHKSMMAYIGLPLDLFGKDAFFQPYLPLQQLDMLKDTQSWLCGSTNTIVTQQKEVELLVNVENGTMEFRDPRVERVAGLTAADRKWMDEIVKDVNETYIDDPTKPAGMHFKGSDDYLRQKFEEYISGALASVKYSAFLAKAGGSGVVITDGQGDPNSSQDFNALWIQEFKKTNAYEVWERVTDPMLFDIVEARHPCSERPSVLADVGLRLSEGIQELKLDQQLAPTREAISRTITAGSTNVMKAMEGLRGRWLAPRSGPGTPVTATFSSDGSAGSASTSSSADEVSKAGSSPPSRPPSIRGTSDPARPPSRSSGLRPLSMAATHPVPVPPPPPVPEPARFSGWVGSFFTPRPPSSRASTASSTRRESSSAASVSSRGPSPHPASPPLPHARDSISNASVAESLPDQALQTRSLDDVYGGVSIQDHEQEAEPADTGVAL